MSKPWEKYQKTESSGAKPWEKYSEPVEVREPAPKTTIGKAKQAALTGLTGLGKALDYAGGVTRTAVAAPFLEKVTAQDVLNAFKAKPLTGEEILERADVPKGGSLSDAVPSIYSESGDEWLKLQRGGPIDPSARGAAGFAVETLTDPTLLLGKLSKAAKFSNMAKGADSNLAQRVLDLAARPIAAPIEGAGRKVYRQGLRNLDRETELLDRASIADILYASGKKGGVKSTKKNIDELRNTTGKELEQIRSNVPSQIDIIEPLTDLDKAAQALKVKGIPELESAGNALENLATGVIVKRGERLSGPKAAELYTDLGQNINFIDPTKSVENMKRLDFQQGVKKQLDQAIDQTGQLKNYKNLNRIYSSAKTVDKAAKRDIKRELGRMGVTQVDAALLGSMVKDPVTGAAMLGGKNLARFLGSHGGATYTGQALKGLATPADLVLRRQSVWQDLMDKENKKKERK